LQSPTLRSLVADQYFRKESRSAGAKAAYFFPKLRSRTRK
jgi:hypothetical protein